MKNASIQTAALTMQSASAAQSGGSATAGLKFLDERESKAATESKHHSSPYMYSRISFLGRSQNATLEAPWQVTNKRQCLNGRPRDLGSFG